MLWISTIVAAVIIVFLLYYVFDVKQPWKIFWPVFLVIMLMVWASALWTTSEGPIYWGVALIPLLFIGSLIAMLLAAMPSYKHRRKKTNITVVRDSVTIPIRRQTGVISAIGILFWIFICLILITVITGNLIVEPLTVRR